MTRSISNHLWRATAFAALLVLVAACGTSTQPEPTVNGVVIDGGDRTIGIGVSQQLTVTVDATGGASTDVSWSSSAEAVVDVDGSGQISGVSAGTATITATSVADSSVSGSIVVTVSPGTVDSVTIDGGDRSLDLGEQVDLDVTVTVSGGALTDVSWSTSDDGIVTVDSDGVIVAVAADATATITATSDVDPSVSGSIVVTVKRLPAPDPTEIYVDASAPYAGNGSQAYPFLTISEGIDAVDAGGIVRVAAGSYAESLFIDKGFDLLGAGAGQVTILSNEDAPGPLSGASIDVQNVDGLTLSGFTLDVVTPGPTIAAIAMPYAGGSSNVLIEDVVIEHTNDARVTRGVLITDSTGVTLRNVDIVAKDPTDDNNHGGAGILISGDSTTIELDTVSTANHEAFAGIAIQPGSVDATISGVTIGNSTFNEINKMSMGSLSGGVVTNLDAPQFVVAVNNRSSAYSSGAIYFYKTSVERAILDSLFNFPNEGGDGVEAWVYSTIQRLDPTDQSIRLNEFIIGSIFDGPEYGYFLERSHFIQAAIDAAEPGALIEVQDGTYAGVDEATFGGETIDGAVIVDVEGVTIQGVGAGSIISAGTGPVFTIDADNVTISDVQFEGAAAVTGIEMGTGDLLTVSASNLLADVALDNTAGATVTAETNWWGDAAGPTVGVNLIDPSAGVDFDPFATSAY